MRIREFVNADVIAQGLSGFQSESVAIQAGRIMLARLRDLAERQADFAFETTLASRSFAPWLSKLRQSGYHVHLLFLWLPTPEMALARVAARVQQGGHFVPDESVRRRYSAGLRNFFQLYLPVVDSWTLCDNSIPEGPELIASQAKDFPLQVANQSLWKSILERYP